MRRILSLALFAMVIVAGLALASRQGVSAQQPAQKTGNLILRGDMTFFYGPGKPRNCNLSNVYKRGDPVGWRIEAVDPQTGQHIEPEAELVVHLNYAGATQDIKMRWRATAQQPERQFWVAKWIVPADAAPGIIRFTVTAKDKSGRTGEYKPFDVDASQLTIAE